MSNDYYGTLVLWYFGLLVGADLADIGTWHSR